MVILRENLRLTLVFLVLAQTLCYQSLSLTCSIVAYSRKTLRESIKIFVAHALHVARIQFQTQASWPCAWYGGLSTRENKIG